MAVIYLKHPLHGAKVAVSEQEAEYDALRGWERFDPTQPLEVKVLPQLDHDGDGKPGGSLPGEQSTVAIGQRKRGRPRKQ